jgi:hypothetical protein
MMKLVETKISEIAVHMRYADNPDSAKATTWVDFQVPIAGLRDGVEHRQSPLDQLEKRFLGSIQEAALLYVQDVIAKEIRATATRRGS